MTPEPTPVNPVIITPPARPRTFMERFNLTVAIVSGAIGALIAAWSGWDGKLPTNAAAYSASAPAAPQFAEGKPPPPVAPQDGVNAQAKAAPTPAPAGASRFPRGAVPSPRWKIFAARPHVAVAAPPQFTPAVILTPAQMSYWGNDIDGDCVSAEEAFAKDIYPVWYSNTGKPVDLPSATVTSWASAHGFLNGADLTSVMDAMASGGMVYQGIKYTDGPYQSVDFTNWTTLTSAIYQGPVKIGLASGQFNAIAGVGEKNGWVMHGFRADGSEDHCVSLCGFGTMQFLASAMGSTLPAGVTPTDNGLLLFTWDTIGLIDYRSFLNITAEAWLRTPTTPQTPIIPTPIPPTPVPPTPAPTPVPPPDPAPTPGPPPGPVTQGTPPAAHPNLSSIIIDWKAGNFIAQAGYGSAWWQPSRDGSWYTSADVMALIAYVAAHDATLKSAPHPANPLLPAPSEPTPKPADPAPKASTVRITYSIDGGPTLPLPASGTIAVPAPQ